MTGMWLLPLLVQCAAAQTGPVEVILDTDIGDDIDDTWAIGMMLGCPQIDLKLIVTGTDDARRKAQLTAKVLEHMGRTDIPLGIGLKTSDKVMCQDAWIGDYDLKHYPGKVHEDGVQALIDVLRAAKKPMTLLLIGPMTNIKEALRRAPDIAQKARIVSMAGSVEIGYEGKTGRQPEYNVVRDIEAARAVFAAPWDITIAPLDGCGTLVLKDERFAEVAQSQAARAKTIIANYDAWSNRKKYGKGESSVLFDTVAVGLVFDESYWQMKTVPLRIDDKGDTIPDEKQGRPVHCAMGWKDREGFEKLLVKTILGGK